MSCLANHRPFADALLVEQVEDGGPPPSGQALDLGCGSANPGACGWRRGGGA